MITFLNGTQPYPLNANLNYTQMAECVKSILYWIQFQGLALS